MRKFLDNAIDTLNSIKHGTLENIKKLLIENDYEVELPLGLDDYCNTEIAYNGGRHPEYASNCFAKIEKIEYDHNSEEILIHFNDGAIQDLTENSVDDVLSVLEMLLTYKEYF